MGDGESADVGTQLLSAGSVEGFSMRRCLLISLLVLGCLPALAQARVSCRLPHRAQLVVRSPLSVIWRTRGPRRHDSGYFYDYTWLACLRATRKRTVVSRYRFEPGAGSVQEPIYRPGLLRGAFKLAGEFASVDTGSLDHNGFGEIDLAVYNLRHRVRTALVTSPG